MLVEQYDKLSDFNRQELAYELEMHLLKLNFICPTLGGVFYSPHLQTSGKTNIIK